MYKGQGLNEKSEIFGSNKVNDACKILVRALGAFQGKKRMTSLKEPPGFVGVDIYIAHYSLSSEYACRSIFVRKGRQISLNQGESTWRTRFQRLKIKMVLDKECSAIGIALSKSGILHPDAVREVLPARPVDKKSIVGYLYGSLVCGSLSSGDSRFKVYGESIPKMTREAFLK